MIKFKLKLINLIKMSRTGVTSKFISAGLDINVCPIPVKTDVGQVDLVLRLSDGKSSPLSYFAHKTSLNLAPN
jgi:hypothetical protein